MMPTVTKKKLKQISQIDFAHKILKNHESRSRCVGATPWYECPPEMWMQEERELWDSVYGLQHKITQEVLKILNSKK